MIKKLTLKKNFFFSLQKHEFQRTELLENVARNLRVRKFPGAQISGYCWKKFGT